jgi:hypothetical protein
MGEMDGGILKRRVCCFCFVYSQYNLMYLVDEVISEQLIRFNSSDSNVFLKRVYTKILYHIKTILRPNKLEHKLEHKKKKSYHKRESIRNYSSLPHCHYQYLN